MKVMRDQDGTQVSDYVCTPTSDPADGVSVYPQLCKGNVLKVETSVPIEKAKPNGDKVVKYICQPLCKYALKVIDPRPAGTNSVVYGNSATKKLITGATETNWFENTFKTVTYKKDAKGKDKLDAKGKKEIDKVDDRCAIQKCEIRDRGCTTAYSGGKLAVTNPKYKKEAGRLVKVDANAKIKFAALANVPDGYTETVCVACMNDGGVVIKDGWVVEQN